MLAIVLATWNQPPTLPLIRHPTARHVKLLHILEHTALDFRYGSVKHYPTFAAPEESASLRCPLRRILRQQLIYDHEGSVTGLHEAEGPVRLEHHGHNGSFHVRIKGGVGDIGSYLYRATKLPGWPTCSLFTVRLPELTATPLLCGYLRHQGFRFDDPSSLDPVASLAKQWIGDCLMHH
jgi:hypothetical protein